MNILIYIPDLGQDWGGVRQYSIGLLEVLAQDTSNHYFVYHNSADKEVDALLSKYKRFTLVRDNDVIVTAVSQKVSSVKRIVNFVLSRLGKGAYFEITSLIDRIIIKYSIDIIHCPYQFIPVTKKAKLITTLHDVQEIHFPDFFTAEVRAFRAVHFLDYMRRANSIVVSYNHVKYDLIKYFSIPENKINTILLEMGKLWFERLIGEPITQLNEFGTSDFILYPANTWEHKNHRRLLNAIALLRDKENYVVNLVCTGHLTKYFDDVIAEEIKALGLDSQVKFLGVVDEKTLYNLYQTCLGVVVPTVYEAGSFPLMESMLMGVPVICSNVTSLPETIGDNLFVFDPFVIESIANKIKSLYSSEQFRNQSKANSMIAGQRLRNTNALDKILSMYISID